MSRRKKKNSALIAIGILLAATAVYIGAGKLLARDAADQYFEVESRKFQMIAQSIDTYYGTFMENQKPFLESTNRRRLEATADIRSGAEVLGGKDSAGLADLIRKSKLIIDTRSRPESGETLSDISFLVEKSPFMNAELFTEKDLLYLSVPLLMPDRYFSTRLDRLGETYDKFSVPIKPTRLINGPNTASILKFDKTAFTGSTGKLAAIFRKFIKPGNVSYRQNSAVPISGQSFKGREIIVSLSEEQATSLLHELAFAVADDDALLQYTYGNIADLSALFDDAGLFRLYGYLAGKGTLTLNDNEKSLLEKLNIKRDVKGFRMDLQKNAAALTIKGGLVMTLVVDNAGNILDRKTRLDLLNTDDNSLAALEMETGSSNTVFEDPRNRFADIILTQYRNTAAGENGSGVGKTTELHIRPDFGKPVDTDSNGSLAVTYLTALQGGSPTGVDMKFGIAAKTDKLTLKKNRIVDYSVKIMVGNGEGTVNGELNELSWENENPNTKNRTATLELNADLPFLGANKFSTFLDLAEEDSFNIEAFAMPGVNVGNTTNLNAAGPKDIDRIKSQAMVSFGRFYLTNESNIDALLGK